MKNITIRSVHVLLALLVLAIAMVPLRDASDGRSSPGSDIIIHGKDYSIMGTSLADS